MGKTLRRYTLGTMPRSLYSSFQQPEGLEPRDYTVQGISASLNEYNTALALEGLGFSYVFQYDVLGGRQVAGGSVVDFYIETVPLPSLLYVQGEYWHSGEQTEKDRFKQSQLLAGVAGQFQGVLELMGDQSATPELARMYLGHLL